MKIILLVSAWVILIVGFLALFQFFFPKIKKWLTTGKINYSWLFAICAATFVILSFPVLFNFWALNFWHLPREVVDDYTKLGALGDIYGSLNALISSAALCAVAYSTRLQLKAIKESKETSDNSALTNQFYSLMTFKNEMFYQLKFKQRNCFEEYIVSNEKLKNINAIDSLKLIVSIFKDEICINDKFLEMNYEERLKVFTETLNSIFSEEINELVSYFYIYGELINLIKNTQASEKLKENLRSVLRSTMLQEEQIVLFYFACVFTEINLSLEDSEIFNKFHYPIYHKFALKFHKSSHFKSPSWKKVFEENSTQS